MRWLGLLLLLLPCSLHAADIYDCYNGSAEQGGNFITTNGISSLQYVQQSFPGAQVDVFNHNTVVHATIWQDAAGTIPLANPFSASSHGVAFVCAADGRYDFQYSLGGIPVPFTVSDIKFCFACSGGGGAGINPGTPFQVTRYDATGNNIQNSSGEDNPIFGPPQWSNGLSVASNGLAKLGINSSAGTTVNLLVCADTTVTTMTQVKTCPTSTNKTFGVADNGAGTSGNVEIYDHGYHACIFDNQTVVNDYVGPSTSIAGNCSDVGPTKPSNSIVIGRVTTLNTGIGTLATVDLQPWDTVSGPGGSGTVNNCGSANSVAFYLLAGTAVNCDPLHTDDNAGNVTMESLGLINTNYAGFYYQKQGPAPPSTPANAVAEYPPTSVTAYAEKRPGVVGSVGQTRVIQSLSTDGAGNPIAVEAWGTAGGLTGASTLTNPSVPTVTPTGTPGATAYSYGIVGCQDVALQYCSAISPIGSTSTGNASLSSSNYNALTAYADTLYGYRGYVICRTAGGATQGIITSTLLAGKKFNDTGLTADGSNCATKYATNTTLTWIWCMGSSLPGYPTTPGFPCGVDGPPLTPAALDDEMMQTFGAPADVNDPFWTWVNQGSATATWSNGAIILTADTTASLNMEMLQDTLPTAPYTFITYVDLLSAGPTTPICVLGFRESSTNKMATALIYSAGARDSTADNFVVGAYNWTSNTANSAVHYYPSPANAFYLKIQNDGSGNLNFWYSPSGDGINYIKVATETVTTAFTTAPNQLVIGVGSTATVAPSCTFDYVRRTQ